MTPTSKSCTKCLECKPLESFHFRNISKGYRDSWCKSCVSYRMKAYWRTNPSARRAASNAAKKMHADRVRQRYQEYCKANPGKLNAKTAKRRAIKMNQTPPWADLKAIEKFYQSCPKGFHVDHIIPLQGKTVRGLHVLHNLQYLPASENCAKGNRL